MKTALLIIDVQNAMFSYEDATVFNANGVLNNIAHLLTKSRSANVPVIFIQHTSKEDDEFREGTTTWEVHPKLTPLETETVVKKTTWDSFHETTLQEELQLQQIEKLIIVGMQTEFCVDTTCRRAFSMGYKSILVKDAHSTFDQKTLTASQIIEHHNATLGGRFVQLKTTDEIVF